MNRREFVASGLYAAGHWAGATRSSFDMGTVHGGAEQPIRIRPETIVGGLPHTWEECIGSDRAVVALRAQWLADLELVRNSAGIKMVRFHGLFSEEMGVWPSGKAPNFLYVDAVLDGILGRGIKPFVELSFMPTALASGIKSAFFYHGNITPPKDLAKWGELIRAFAAHCVQRYGVNEVRSWKFEVWNEPNLAFFWSGTKQDYFDLYRTAALALKGVDSQLWVGGPATAATAWIPDLLAFCSDQRVPIDFVSTHIYPDDPQKDIFTDGLHYPVEEVIPEALANAKQQIGSSSFPSLPLYVTEWSSQNPAFIAHTLKHTIGLADMMSYWTFDNVFEELGIPKGFLNNSFGLIGQRGVPRPSFHTFTLLHRLGSSQIESSAGPVLATRHTDQSLAVMIWNLVPQSPMQHSSTGDPALQSEAEYDHNGIESNFSLIFEGSRRKLKGRVTKVDQQSGNLRRAYTQIGSPPYPTQKQIEELKELSGLAPSIPVVTDYQGKLSVSVPPNGVALLELS